jgi:hypothetical protein
LRKTIIGSHPEGTNNRAAHAPGSATELRHRIDALHRRGPSDSAVEQRLERVDLPLAFPDGSIGRLGPIVASHVTAIIRSWQKVVAAITSWRVAHNSLMFHVKQRSYPQKS